MSEPIQITIPKDHPDAEKLLAALNSLATRTVMPSGLVIQKRETDDAAVEESLELLRKFLAPQYSGSGTGWASSVRMQKSAKRN